MAKLLLYRTPRVLAIAFILFISLFALDVFEEEHGFVQIAAALLARLVPSFVLLTVLVFAWKWEWVGALFFAAAAGLMLFVVWAGRIPFYVGPLEHKTMGSFALAGPALLVALLFLLGWLRRHKSHAPDRHSP